MAPAGACAGSRTADGDDLAPGGRPRPRQPPEAPLPATEVRRLIEASGYELERHAAHLIRRAHQRATARFQDILGEDDLTPTQFAVLATLLRDGEVSQIQLGRSTAMDPSTVSTIVRRLLTDGLIERSASPADGRLTLIRLNARGQRYTLPRLARSMAVSRTLLAPLTAAEQRTFMRLLRKVTGDEA